MKGSELLAILQSLSQEDLAKELSSEGCDCDGEVEDLEVETNDLYLTRRRRKDGVRGR